MKKKPHLVKEEVVGKSDLTDLGWSLVLEPARVKVYLFVEKNP